MHVCINKKLIINILCFYWSLDGLDLYAPRRRKKKNMRAKKTENRLKTEAKVIIKRKFRAIWQEKWQNESKGRDW